MNDEFIFVIKKGEELTEDEKERLMEISIAEYPSFEKYYREHKYYSVIKPQMVGLVIKGDVIIGKGKLLWQNVFVGDKKIKLFGFGVLIDSKHQGQGLGTQLIKRYIEKARELDADVVYASTSNPIIDKMLPKLGFTKLSIPVTYTHAVTGYREQEKGRSYILEFTEGLLKEIESQPLLYLGPGPL